MDDSLYPHPQREYCGLDGYLHGLYLRINLRGVINHRMDKVGMT